MTTAIIDLPEIVALPPGWLGFQMRRLQRLLDLEHDHTDHLNSSGRRLLSHAIFVTYLECRDSGGGDMARAVLKGDRLESGAAAAG